MLFLELWEDISEDQTDATSILEDPGNAKISHLPKLHLDDNIKESMLRKQQLWNEAVLHNKR